MAVRKKGKEKKPGKSSRVNGCLEFSWLQTNKQTKTGKKNKMRKNEGM